MNNLDACDKIETMHSYAIFSLAKTPEEEAALTEFWTPFATAQECADFLFKFRCNEGRQRRRGRRPLIISNVDDLQAVTSPEDDLADEMETMTERQSRVVLLRMEGYTFEEIAEIVGASRQSCQLWVEQVREKNSIGRRA